MAARPIPHAMTTTVLTLDGYRSTKSLGVVRGVTVRSRSIFGTIGAGLETHVGGNISLFTTLCEKTRAQAFELMVEHAQELGANAVIGIAVRCNRSDGRRHRSPLLRYRRCNGTGVVD